ncbi:short-chain fatty acyl-CoA regulator family protein [Caulobacter sp. S45]|uniref:helix-turn-helix domain-containing protein n=1 Tax=Caulobacter sp. S45 TaxID=1641861 RepID=UPI00131C3600|nr:helix-turn-helix transcriptional regulator [Caulobacter sp. S45]
MAERSDRKLFLGARMRRLRRELDLTQTRMAQDLGVSPSYLNLIERNQRPVTAQVLLRLADAYELDLRSFSAEAEAGGASLVEIFADPLFKDLAVSRHEISELAENAPGVAEAVVRLYQSHLDRRRLIELGDVQAKGGEGASIATPSDWVRTFIQSQRNFFPELDERAEALAHELDASSAEVRAVEVRQRLQTRFGIRVQVATAELMQGELRRFDLHRKRLFLSELLGGSGRSFSAAYQLALLEFAESVAALVQRAAPPDPATRNLLRVSLGNYLAAAILAPYGDFHAAAEAQAYDLGHLCVRFGLSFEQACHRLTTLGRPGARGVPFFMMRIDPAGNVSKRFAADASFPFARFGGGCPRWNLHGAFRTPGRIVTQIVETQDGVRHFTLGRTVRRAGVETGEDDLAVGLGCEIKHAARLAYARGLDLNSPAVMPIGPTCRLCERQDCPQRAAQPVSRTLLVDEHRKSISPYPFANA